MSCEGVTKRHVLSDRDDCVQNEPTGSNTCSAQSSPTLHLRPWHLLHLKTHSARQLFWPTLQCAAWILSPVRCLTRGNVNVRNDTSGLDCACILFNSIVIGTLTVQQAKVALPLCGSTHPQATRCNLYSHCHGQDHQIRSGCPSLRIHWS